MSVEDCGNVALPSWSYSINTLDAEQQDASDPASRIASLLLAKLADYVVPGWSSLPRNTIFTFFPQILHFYTIPSLGCQTLLSPSSSEPDTSLSHASSKGALKSDEVGEEGEAVDGKLSIFIHKREDQSSHEVLQPLLRYVCL